MKFLNFIKSLIAPILSLILVVCSSAPFMTFISLKMNAEGYSEASIGATQAFFYLGYLIGSIRAERLVKRIGYIRSFAAFSSLYCGCMLIQGIFMNFYVWSLMRLLGGLSLAALYVVIESWLLTESSNSNRGKILAVYMIALYFSQSLSQLIIKFIDINTTVPFLLFGLLCSFSILPVSMNYSKAPEYCRVVTKKSIKEIYHSSPFGFIGCLMSGLILSAIYSLLPVFAVSSNVSVSYIMAITIAGGFLLQWPLGHLSDIFDRRSVLILVSLLAIIPSIIIMFFKTSYIIYTFSFFLGGFTFTIYPLSINQVCDRIDSTYISYVMGILSLLYGIGAMTGPIICSFFMEITPLFLYLYILLTCALLALIGMYFKAKSPKAVLADDKTEFVPMTSTAPISELDPRVTEPQVQEENNSSS
ncbi:MAG: MFS transporter [Parachlamydiales bacterium]|nr:MFS transporter [Parachlamydiales bacterium]